MKKLTFFAFVLSVATVTSSVAIENDQTNLPDDDKYKVIKVNGQIQVKKQERIFLREMNLLQIPL